MNYREKLSKINQIYNKIQDLESREIFDARINHMVMRNDDEYLRTVVRDVGGGVVNS